MALLQKLACTYLLALQSQALKLAAPQQRWWEPPEVWISSFPRSASSTMLSLVRAGAPDEETFALFEPCHPGDEMGKKENGEEFRNKVGNFDCPEVVQKLAHCDFSNVDYLWGWTDPHTTTFGKDYSQDFAQQNCTNAKRRIIKTVGATNHFDPGRLTENMLWVLERRPHMKILNLVRDPRSIYTSWKHTPAFEAELHELEKNGSPLWKETCDTFSANLKMEHPRVFTVVYEKLVMSPESYMKEIYDFLDFEFGGEQLSWVQTNFPEDSHGCPGGGTWKYADCQGKENSIEEMNSWREALSAEEKEHFATYEPCQTVMKAYGFPEQ